MSEPASSSTASAKVTISQCCRYRIYWRLGGYDALAAVSNGFLNRLAADSQRSKFFVEKEKNEVLNAINGFKPKIVGR